MFAWQPFMLNLMPFSTIGLRLPAVWMSTPRSSWLTAPLLTMSVLACVALTELTSIGRWRYSRTSASQPLAV